MRISSSGSNRNGSIIRPVAEPTTGLANQFVSVPAESCFPTRYAVRAELCLPAFDDTRECLYQGDLLIIETSTEFISQNSMVIHGKLCVIAVPDQDRTAIRLYRTKRWTEDCPEGHVRLNDNDQPTRLQRAIHLPGENSGEQNRTDDVTEKSNSSGGSIHSIDHVVGVVIQLIRNYD